MQFKIEEAVAILARTPGIVRSLATGLPPTWARADYGVGTWSVHEIVGHLIWGERTDWIPRARHILMVGTGGPFEPFARNGHEALCRDHSTAELLDLFDQSRSSSIQELRQLNLAAADLPREGVHPALGTVTLAQLLATWVVHDLNHIAQIAKATAWQYRDEVGPWIQYLSILAPPNPR